VKVLVTGSNGQLGWELERTRPETIDGLFADRNDLDIADYERVLEYTRKHRPDVIVNAAAYTAVDKAEEEPEKAFLVNEAGARNIALAAKEIGARVIQISTDFVFDGKKSTPYTPEDEPNPINVYGKSKLAGEKAVLELLPEQSIVLRTAWLYSSHGHNFVKTMLRLMKEKDEIKVVCDQIGTPTWARGLAEVVWKFCKRGDLSGIYHWTDGGVASWYDFAVAVKEFGSEFNLLPKDGFVLAVGSIDFISLANRPSFGLLDKSKTWLELEIVPNHWRVQLRHLLGKW